MIKKQQKDWQRYGIKTRAVRAGHERTHEGEHSEPIFTTSSFVFDSAAHAAARFSGDEPGNVYARFTNPTVRTFEQRLATMEGAESCVATASGMAAILATCMGLLKAGDHVVAAQGLFGSTILLFKNILSQFGIQFDFVSLADVSAWQVAVKPNTKLFFVETPSNPMTEVADISALAKLAHDNDALLVVDNCFCTPILQQPLSLGADIVVHSATKYIDGQGRCLGGAVVGDQKYVGTQIFAIIRTAGPTMSAFNAWVFLKGLETLAVRMQVISDSALQLANWLEQQPGVSRVYYPGLASHPQYELVCRQQSAGGGIVSFEVAGGREMAWKVIDNTELLSITANLGDTKTTITHPATTTHGRWTEEERGQAGIGQGLVRIAVGLEDMSDIVADLERGLTGS